MAEHELKIEELTDETLAELLRDASPCETKYLLEIVSWNRPGPSFEDWGRYEVLVGEVKAVLMGSSYNYPYEDSNTYLLVPLTLPVVVRHWGYSNTDGDRRWERLYIFTRNGWQKVEVV